MKLFGKKSDESKSSTNTRKSSGSGLLSMFKNLKMRNKMLVVAIPPLVAVVILSIVGIVDRNAEAEEATNTVALIEFSRSNAALAASLRNESIYSVAYMTAPTEESRNSAKTKLDQARLSTDTTAENYRRSLETTQPESRVPDLVSPVGALNERVENLPTTRTGVDGAQIPVTQVKDYYSDSAGSSDRIALLLSQSITTPELVGGFASAANLAAWQTAVSSEASALVAVEQKGFFFDDNDARCEQALSPSCVSYSTAQEFLYRANAAEDVLLINSSVSDIIETRDRMAEETYSERSAVIYNQGVNGNQVSSPAEEGENITNSSVSLLNSIADLEQSVISDTSELAAGVSSDAQRAVWFFALAALLATVIASAAALYAAKLTTDPLVRLTRAARNLSEERIPDLVRTLRDPQSSRSDAEMSTTAVAQAEEDIESISVGAKDEIGELAQAFSSIQEVTVEVAGQQSELLQKGIGDIFVNLARRNQLLLDRQIQFIEKMEEGEEDPDQLGNLFKLDHLATRMRRNAESLLVLAGAEQARGKRGQKVSMSDVIRVGMGEVEDFQRVRITRMDPVDVPGNVASDLAHMLGELIENATQFSPPDTFVEIDGNLEASGVYYMRIVDRGIGMTNDAISAANHLLANPPFMGLDISRSLGFIVVGRLASRFSIQVTLSPNPGGGIIATVAIPPATIHDASREGTSRQPISAESAEGYSDTFSPPSDRPQNVVRGRGAPVPQPESAENVGFQMRGNPAALSSTAPHAPQNQPPPEMRPTPPPRPQPPVLPSPHPTPQDAPPQSFTSPLTPPPPPPLMPPPADSGSGFGNDNVRDVANSSENAQVDPRLSAPQGMPPPSSPPAHIPPPATQQNVAPPPSPSDAPALPKRKPGLNQEKNESIMNLAERHASSAQRTPEQVRQMLSRYRSGVTQGKSAPPESAPPPSGDAVQMPPPRGAGVPPSPQQGDTSLTQRTPKINESAQGQGGVSGASGVSRSSRSPDEVKDVLLRYRSGLQKAKKSTD